MAGVALVLAGLAMRSWAAGILCKNHGLATTGPYSLCRHPLYVGSYLMMIGFGVLIPDPWSAGVIFGPILLLYFLTLHREEEFQSARLGGTWSLYAARVAWFFPKRRPAELFSPWSFVQWRQNREYCSMGNTLFALAVLHIWRIFVDHS